jgi:AcrR family transcriptional regulator
MSKNSMLKKPILLAAVRLASSQGLRGLKRREIAEAVGCAPGSVSWHFDSMEALRGAVIDYAVENEIIEVLVQARAERDPRLGRLSPALKERVANRITGR